MLSQFVEYIPPYAAKFINQNWPGKTTLIFKTLEFVPSEFTQNGTVAFRIPGAPELINTIEQNGFPVVTTSANFSGEQPSSKNANIPQNFKDLVNYNCPAKINNDSNKKPRASKIIDCTGPEPKIIRD